MTVSSSTYTYRDGRRKRIADALAALGADPQGLRGTLEGERSALKGDDWTVTDRTYLAVAEDWLWGTRELLKASVDADPAFAAVGKASSLTDAQAAAIQALPRVPGGPSPDFMAGVRAAIGDDDAVLTELVHAAHHLWLAQPADSRAYPFDDVGVLLPLRLETLFDAPESDHNPDHARWKLSLRVVPDEASILRDDSHVSAGELSALRAFWAAVQKPGPFHPGWLDGDAAGVAWAMLARQVTPARAAWLVAAVQPQVDGDALRVDPPPGMPPVPQPNRVAGLPPRLHVTAATRDANDVVTVHEIGWLPTAQGSTIDVDALRLPLPGKPAATGTAWWTSWDTAMAVGLGGEWLLDPGLGPDTLDAIHVVGVSDEPPDALFQAQSDAGELGVLRLGSPTNTIQGAPAADLATDAETWRSVARARIGQRLDPGASVASSSGTNIERYVTGSENALPFFPGADLPDDTLDSQRIAQALWPALEGHWLADLWGAGEDAFRVGRWAFLPSGDAVPPAGDFRSVLLRVCDADPREPVPRNLCPEGPLMPLRIGDQPYGLLPVTALSLWQPRDPLSAEEQAQQGVEEGMARALVGLRAVWAKAARRNGNVVGASTARFMELLARDALSRRYILRWFAPAETWMAPYQLDPGGRDKFNQVARDLYAGAADVIGRMPQTLFLSNGAWRPSLLPLVQPTRWLHAEDSTTRIDLRPFLALVVELGDQLDLEQIFQRFLPFEPGGEFRARALPDSLLVRLLVHACQISSSWGSNGVGGAIAPAVLLAQLEATRAICCELDQPAWRLDDRDPITGEPIISIKVPDERRGQLERALRATLDTAAHRIDPWITGFAWARLREHADSPRRAHRMGSYGWLDGPFVGRPGPTDAGRLHVPSYNQALAAIVLRDRFLSSGRGGATNDDGQNPWELHITSGRARLAEEIADEVRLGFHIYEVVGRQVEHVVAAHQKVRELRTNPTYAMRAERLDPNEVCNGIEALRGLLAGDPQFPLDDGQRAALQMLHDALDTYADLLIADGVMQLVNRQTDRAAETMDAAAGFSRPPSFEFIRTPPSGYQLESLVVAAVPYLPVSAVPADASPIRLADPSLAAFVEGRLGAGWTWTAVNEDDGTQIGTVTLEQMGLAPLDTLALSEDFLNELARRTRALPLVYVSEGRGRAWVVSNPDGSRLGSVSSADLGLLPDALAALDTASLQGKVRAALGAPADAVVEEVTPDDLRLWIAADERGALVGLATIATLGISAAEASAMAVPELHQRVRAALHLPQVRVDAPAQHRLAQDLAGALGDRPAAGRDLIRDPAAQRAADADIYAELRDRYVALHRACEGLASALGAAADDAGRATLLRRALGWGVTPLSEPADREGLFAALTGTVAPAGATSIADLATAAAAALQGRIAAAPAPADLVSPELIGAPVPDQEQRKRAQLPDGVPTLAAAIANLASPQGKLAILAPWPRADFVAAAGMHVEAADAALDEEWLTVVAAVRPPLARLEALQLELDAPLVSWSSSPGDPWRTADAGVVQANLRARGAGSALDMSLDERFVAAYGAQEAWVGEKVAIGLIDAFSEAIPMPQRSTMTAFGFNAPAARPPQAILLAVPPQPRQRLDEDLLRQIVDETRELAHARTAHIEDLGDLQALTPTSWLEASGTHGVRLEPYPLFT